MDIDVGDLLQAITAQRNAALNEVAQLSALVQKLQRELATRPPRKKRAHPVPLGDSQK